MQARASSDGLIAIMRKELNISEFEAKARIKAMVSGLAGALGEGRKMEVRGFGVISAKVQYDRVVRCPRDNSQHQRDRVIYLNFSPSKPLKIIHS